MAYAIRQRLTVAGGLKRSQKNVIILTFIIWGARYKVNEIPPKTRKWIDEHF